MSKLRKQSINILKEAVKNKSLACYDESIEKCLYLHGKTGKKCAVGAIIPDKILQRNLNSNGDCVKFKDKLKNTSVTSQLQHHKTFRGMKLNELEEMQNLHDEILLEGSSPLELENYINQLK